MARDRLKFVKTLFPVRGIGWQGVSIILAVVALVGLGALASAWSSFRDALSDFLNADLEVWHLLIVLVVELVAAAVMGMRAFRQLSAPDGRGRKSLYPREIDYLGVKWSVLAVESSSSRTITHFKVGRPMCPKHRSTLSMVATAGDDDAEEDVVIPLDDALGDMLGAQRMFFECPNDGARYDLRGAALGMQTAKDFVNDLAMGQHRTILAEAGGKG